MTTYCPEEMTVGYSFSRDKAAPTSVDCPECRGHGTATVWRALSDDPAVHGKRLLTECSQCDLWDDPTASPPATSEPTSADEPTSEDSPDEDDSPEPTFPRHTGAGWWELSDGSKVRGEEDAQRAQEALDMATGE